jgi:hypothetical protein
MPKLLVDLVADRRGGAAAAELRARAGLPDDHVIKINQVYPDDQWQRLFAGAGEMLGTDTRETERVFARWFCEDSLRRWPTWFAMSSTAREFLARQPVIHNCIATGLGGGEAGAAVTDKFRLEPCPDGFVMHYRSPNRLCGLYEALAREILAHYGDDARIEHPRCQHRGDPQCDIRLVWAG